MSLRGDALILVCFILCASASFVALRGAAAHAQAAEFLPDELAGA